MVRLKVHAMNLETLQELLSDTGRQALAEAMSFEPVEERFLQHYEKLRKKCPAPLAKAALEMAILRIKAQNKFSAADRMYITREALEQASGEVPANYRAERFAQFGEVADLCCGIGSDAFGLARKGLIVEAVELDPIKLAMTKANAAALSLEKAIHPHQGDASTIPLPQVKAAFADPSRRSSGRRYLDPEDYTPPLSQIRARFPKDFPLAVKIAPGVAWNDIIHLGVEADFVSVDGEMKECVLWFGPLRTTARRATILPGGLTLSADQLVKKQPIGSAQEYVFDPDPAIVRAGLEEQLATCLGIVPLDYQIAIFTGRNPIQSPFVNSFRVEWATRFHLAHLRVHLREKGVGRVTFIKRGSKLDSDELLKKLKLEGEHHRIVILTRIGREETMIVAERV